MFLHKLLLRKGTFINLFLTKVLHFLPFLVNNTVSACIFVPELKKFFLTNELKKIKKNGVSLAKMYRVLLKDVIVCAHNFVV